MPAYTFRCDSCMFTMQQSFRIAEAIVLPMCLACDRQMRRVWEAPGVQFRGDGWGGKP